MALCLNIVNSVYYANKLGWRIKYWKCCNFKNSCL